MELKLLTLLVVEYKCFGDSLAVLFGFHSNDCVSIDFLLTKANAYHDELLRVLVWKMEESKRSGEYIIFLQIFCFDLSRPSDVRLLLERGKQNTIHLFYGFVVLSFPSHLSPTPFVKSKRRNESKEDLPSYLDQQEL